MTHNELVKRAMHWLTNTKQCAVAVSELAAGFEVADAIGWRSGFSYLIEAKTSLSDFKADRKKTFRRMPETGLGYRRYYIVPFDLKDKVIDLLPEKWGLLAANQRSVFIMHEPKDGIFPEHNLNREMDILLSIIRRMWDVSKPLEGVGVKWYLPLHGSNYEPRAELFVKSIE